MNWFSILSALITISGVLSLDQVSPADHDVSIQLGEVTSIEFKTAPQPYEIVIVFKNSSYADVLNVTTIHQDGTGRLWIQAKALTSNFIFEAVECFVPDNSTLTCPLNLSQAFIRLTVFKSRSLVWLVDIVGWAYFFAWSISFYPQIFLNCRRKSVIGLNFDFLLLNVIGFSAYTLYNLLLYCNAHVQEEYEELHPRSPIPVLLNDVVFAVHALIACLITGAQCFIFERDNQRISRPCILLASLLILGGCVSAILAATNVFNLLTFASSLSSIKLIVTSSKYFPQAIYNFTRKSTVGWSIGNVLLDLSGGTLDILQMILQAINFSDWSGFYGNPVKFGLGLVSIIFDFVFIIQHYVLYRYVEVAHNEYAGIDNPEAQARDPDTRSNASTEYGSNEFNRSHDRIIPEV